MINNQGWKKSSYSAGSGNDCIEVKALDPQRQHIGVRDSKDPQGPHLEFSAAALTALVGAINAGEFGTRHLS